MKRIVSAIVLLALVQLACAASANIGSPTPAPTPLPPPTPQVIVIDRPVPTPASNDTGLLVPVLIVLMFTTVMAGGVGIGYIASRGQKQQPSPAQEPTSITLTTNNYYNAPPQLTEFEQYQLLKQQGYASQIAQQIIAEGRASQYLLSASK